MVWLIAGLRPLVSGAARPPTARGAEPALAADGAGRAAAEPHAVRRATLCDRGGSVSTIVGVAWYEPDEWDQLRAVAPDAEKLEATHAEWLAFAEKASRISAPPAMRRAACR